MNKQLKFSMFAVVGATIGLGLLAVSQLTLAAPAAYLPEQAVVASPGLPTLNPINKAGEVVHILPTRKLAADLAAASAAVGFADNGPLLYHAGGKIMPSVISYIIYWTPPKLQTGAVAGWSAAYQNLQTRFLTDYQGHSLANNNTQYYQTISGVTSYIHDTGGVSGVYVDTAAYPASGCSDSITPGNCLSDAQIQAEIKKVMALKGWTPGMNKIFFVYTAKGEGSNVIKLRTNSLNMI
jgi:hypothetical protein